MTSNTKRISSIVDGKRIITTVSLTETELEEIEGRKTATLLVPIYTTKEAASKALITWVNDFAKSVTGDVPIDEKLSWDAKEAAAAAYLSSTATPHQVELINSEAVLTGEAPLDLSNIIVSKAALYRSVVSRMAGLRRATQSLLKSADINADPKACDAILENAKAQALAMATALGIEV